MNSMVKRLGVNTTSQVRHGAHDSGYIKVVIFALSVRLFISSKRQAAHYLSSAPCKIEKRRYVMVSHQDQKYNNNYFLLITVVLKVS